MRRLSFLIKRMFDIWVSSICLILLLPFFVVTAILLEFFMPGPIFFKQNRIGKNGKPFNILKIRSMKVDKIAEKQHDFSKDDERITLFGKIIRRLKIDEIPQLMNVFLGEMSLVGPRPTI